MPDDFLIMVGMNLIGRRGHGRMRFSENDPARVILDQLDQIEALVDHLEQIAIALRGDDQHAAADDIMQAIRDQRFKAMLVRGQAATW